jgi:hypothetical protein
VGCEDLKAFDAPRQCGTKTGTSDVLRKFDQDTTLLTRVVLSLVLVAAAVLGWEELVQTNSVRPSADTVRATDQPQETQITSSTPPETSYRSVETPASNPLVLLERRVLSRIPSTQQIAAPYASLLYFAPVGLLNKQLNIPSASTKTTVHEQIAKSADAYKGSTSASVKWLPWEYH